MEQRTKTRVEAHKLKQRHVRGMKKVKKHRTFESIAVKISYGGNNTTEKKRTQNGKKSGKIDRKTLKGDGTKA